MRWQAIAAVLFSVLTALTSLHADNWPQWRGPEFNGVASGENYPVSWSVENDRNIAWSEPLPEGGGSTPAVWGDRIFVTSPGGGKNTLLCYAADGGELWRKSLGDDAGGKHRKGSGANPSPTTDGELVFAYFRSGDLAAVDFDGQIVWHVNTQERFGADSLWWDLGSSPVLTDEHVIVTCMQTGPSYLAAFDKQSGELVWKHDRMLDAPEEAAQSYSTPVVVEHEGRDLLVVVGADHVTLHEAADGEELWRLGGLNPEQNRYFRSIASAAVTGGFVVAPYARGETITGIRLGGPEGDGDSPEDAAWHLKGLGADVPTPAAQGGKAYLCTDKGRVVCLRAMSGEQVWEQELPKNRNVYSASPVLAGGYLYCTREDGGTFVLDAENGELKGENDVAGQFTLATPVFANGHIYIKTFEALHCISEK